MLAYLAYYCICILFCIFLAYFHIGSIVMWRCTLLLIYCCCWRISGRWAWSRILGLLALRRWVGWRGCRQGQVAAWWGGPTRWGGQALANQNELASNEECTLTCCCTACWNGTGTACNRASWNGSCRNMQKNARKMQKNARNMQLFA